MKITFNIEMEPSDYDSDSQPCKLTTDLFNGLTEIITQHRLYACTEIIIMHINGTQEVVEVAAAMIVH